MRYVNARLNSYQREQAYRFYISDGIKLLTANTVQSDENAGYLQKRYYDITHPETVKEDTRTGEEIAADIIKRAGIEVVE